MTRETALRRILAGHKVQHSAYPNQIFFYDKNSTDPIRRIGKGMKMAQSGQSDLFEERKGWREYRNDK